MSKRRKHGDKAWVTIDMEVKECVIHVQSNPWQCRKCCGDDDCVEVHKVECKDGTEDFHVPECCIFDSYEDACCSLKDDDCQSPY